MVIPGIGVTIDLKRKARVNTNELTDIHIRKIALQI